MSFGRMGARGGFGSGGLLGGSKAPYLGAVATRNFINDVTFGSAAGWNTVTPMYARDTIVNPQLLFCNWFVTAGTGETNGGGTQTNTCSREDPVGGTRYQGTPVGGGGTSLAIAHSAQRHMQGPVTLTKGAFVNGRR